MHYPDLGSASDWLKENYLAAQPIRSTTKIWVVHVISKEFLRSLPRRRFARAQMATSRNVGCFLRLGHLLNRYFPGGGGGGGSPTYHGGGVTLLLRPVGCVTHQNVLNQKSYNFFLIQ